MDIFNVIICLIIVGVVFGLLWMAAQYIPFPQPIKNGILALLLVLAAAWVASLLLGGGGHIPRVIAP